MIYNKSLLYITVLKLMKVIDYRKFINVITIILFIAMKSKITIFKIPVLKSTLRCSLSIIKNYLLRTYT